MPRLNSALTNNPKCGFAPVPVINQQLRSRTRSHRADAVKTFADSLISQQAIRRVIRNPECRNANAQENISNVRPG